MSSTRKEIDAIGPVDVPRNAYYGSFTTRALANFQISGIAAPTAFQRAFGMVKLAACRVNRKLGGLTAKEAKAMDQAAREFIEGRFDDEFQIDVYQAGAGTPYNMNTNEIIANRANEILGGKKGKYEFIHPNNHVNMAQSSNDTNPTATRIAILMAFKPLKKEMVKLAKSFERLGKKHSKLLKVGRTHLEDAVPVTLGQEFDAYAAALRTALVTIEESEKALRVLGIGGTAMGTGINTDPKFAKMMCAELSKLSAFKLTPAKNKIETTHSHSALLKASSALRALAIEVNRIANDLRLLNMGPKAGLAEIVLPEVEPGSSIMPGKVNPSTAECMNMICFQVIGCDEAVSLGAQGGQLELNWFTPLIMWNVMHSSKIMSNGLKMFREHCVDGIKVNRAHIKETFENSLVTATALAPYLGYHVMAECVNEALAQNRPLREVVASKNLIPEKTLDKLLSPEKMVKPQVIDQKLVKKLRQH